MDTKNLFSAALQLQEPWYVKNVEFTPKGDDPKAMELHIYIDFKKGAAFALVDDNNEPVTDDAGQPIMLKAHDTVERKWRHLNFFQHEAYLHARVPKVSDGNGHCPTVSVPWARKGSGFTLLFESFVLELAKHMPVSAIADLVGENDTRLWYFIRQYVAEALERVDMSETTGLGMDETSIKGHHYITVVVDLESHNVLFVTEGKDHSTVDSFVAHFKEHGGSPDKVKIVTCDMSLGFKKGITDNFINSQTIIDKFHVIKHANEAVDDVRKAEAKDNALLRGTKYWWLKNDENLTDSQRQQKEKLSKKHLKVSRAYAMRVELQDIYENCRDRESAEARLKKLCSWMMHSRINRMKKFCQLLRDHWDDILNYFDNRYTNAILEGTNSVIQNIKTRCRGFRNVEYFKCMIYLICGGLDIDAIIKQVEAEAFA